MNRLEAYRQFFLLSLLLASCGAPGYDTSRLKQQIATPDLTCNLLPGDNNSLIPLLSGLLGINGSNLGISCVIDGSNNGVRAESDRKSKIKIGETMTNPDGSSTVTMSVDLKNGDGNYTFTLSTQNCQSVFNIDGKPQDIGYLICSDPTTVDLRVQQDTTPPTGMNANLAVKNGVITGEVSIDDLSGVGTVEAGLTKQSKTTQIVLNQDRAVLNIEQTQVGDNKIYIKACDPLNNCGDFETVVEYNPFAGIQTNAVYNQTTGQMEMDITFDNQQNNLDPQATQINGQQDSMFPIIKSSLDCQDCIINPNNLHVVCTPVRRKGSIVMKVTMSDILGHKQSFEVPVDGIDPFSPIEKSLGLLITFLSLSVVTAASHFGVRGVTLAARNRKFHRLVASGKLTEANNFLDRYPGRRMPKRIDNEKLLADKGKLNMIRTLTANNQLTDAYQIIKELFDKQPADVLLQERYQVVNLWINRLFESINNDSLSEVAPIIIELINRGNWFWQHLETRVKLLQHRLTTAKPDDKDSIYNLLNQERQIQNRLRILQPLESFSENKMQSIIIDRLMRYIGADRSTINRFQQLVNDLLVVGNYDIFERLFTGLELEIKRRSEYIDSTDLLQIIDNTKKQIDQIKNQYDSDFQSIITEARSQGSIDAARSRLSQLATDRHCIKTWFDQYAAQVEQQALVIEREKQIQLVMKDFSTVINGHYRSKNIRAQLSAALTTNNIMQALLVNDTAALQQLDWYDFLINNCPPDQVAKTLWTIILLELMPFGFVYGCDGFNVEIGQYQKLKFEENRNQVLRQLIPLYSQQANELTALNIVLNRVKTKAPFSADGGEVAKKETAIKIMFSRDCEDMSNGHLTLLFLELAKKFTIDIDPKQPNIQAIINYFNNQ